MRAAKKNSKHDNLTQRPLTDADRTFDLPVDWKAQPKKMLEKMAMEQALSRLLGGKCGNRWLSSQQVFCQLAPGHPGMHESDAGNNRSQVHLWWGNE